MRPLRPFCGTVSKAQLLSLLGTIKASAPGVVTTQLSPVPPASSSATDVLESSESRPATVQPPEPPPTTTKSNVSVTRIPPAFLGAKLRFCGVSGKSGSTWHFRAQNPHFGRHKKLKNRSLGLSKAEPR